MSFIYTPLLWGIGCSKEQAILPTKKTASASSHAKSTSAFDTSDTGFGTTETETETNQETDSGISENTNSAANEYCFQSSYADPENPICVPLENMGKATESTSVVQGFSCQSSPQDYQAGLTLSGVMITMLLLRRLGGI